MRFVRPLWLVAALLALACAAGLRPPVEPLPTDPALVTGTLDNGLAYVVRRHANPEGRVSIWLHVATGSLNETEETRGLAHYLEHMAFNGSAHFPPGSLVPYFQSLGLAFGRDQNAFTSFDQTTYQLALPNTRPETLEKGLLFMSDVAFRLALTPAEIDSERQIILEEKRARAGAQQRVQDFVYERLAPGSTFGRRLPIGTEEVIQSVARPAFVDYYSRWYVPRNMTVIIVGDLASESVVELIRRQFADGPQVPRPPDRPVGVRPYAEMRAIVATDPELTQGDVSIVRIEPPRPPVTTVADYRRELVDQIGTWAMNRRFGAQLAEGTAAFLEATASIRQQARAIRIVTLEASGRPGEWRAMLTDLGVALQRARLHGFAEREVADARTALIAQVEEAADREATLPARQLMRQINAVVSRREPVMSAAQRLALLRRLLPGITAEEVSRAFAVNFDPDHVTFLAELPTGADVPSEAELVRLGRVAVDARPEKPTEVARAGTLLKEPPRGGAIVESVTHAESGVTSVWLDNGVRVHHRFMDRRRHEVSVVITLAGGQIEETAANRGISEAALLAWNRPATRTLASTQIRDLMTGRKVRVAGHASADTLTLTVSGDPDELATGLSLAYLLLTDPVIEPAALVQWQGTEGQAIAARKLQPAGVLGETVAAALFPAGQPRIRPLEEPEVRALTLAAAQAWLRRLIAEAPIEVAVVGDLERARALDLVGRYLGALPARPRIGDKTLADLRTMPRPVGPIRIERRIDARTPQSVVLDGFFGTDIQNVRDVRLLVLAARVLTTRMNREIREKRQLVYSIGASSQPASEYPGFGRFVAQAPTDPQKSAALAAALDEMYGAFAATGPSEPELEVAQRQLGNILDERLRDPEFWLDRLAILDYRGLSLDDVMDIQAAYRRVTAAEVREAFARYYRPEARFRIVIDPR